MNTSQKVNYQSVLDRELNELRRTGKTPALLLHACCAPCSSYVLEYLSDYFNITLFYYNPNIFPEEEYNYRAAELIRLANEMPLRRKPEVIVGKYDQNEFYKAAEGFESEPEGGQRCSRCYRLRLENCAELADAGKFDYFTTTLSISPYKNAELLNQIGMELAIKYNVSYLCSDFKKKGGYLRSIKLSEQYHLYRQNYCGCVFSQTARER